MKAYKYKSILKKHIRTIHTNDSEVHKCPYCRVQIPIAGYRYESILKEHIRTIHSNVVQTTIKDSEPLKFKCQECGKIFYNESNMKRHMRTHSELPESFDCSRCNKLFTRPDNLQRHLRKHGLVSDFNFDSMEESYENGFVCKMCGMNFGEVIVDLQHHLGLVCNHLFLLDCI